MITDAPDRVTIYHTASTGDPPDWQRRAGPLRAKVRSLSQDQVLAANAEGRHEYRATHTMRVEPNALVVQKALAKLQDDGKCFLILEVRESNFRPRNKPDHLICDLAVMPDDTA